MIIVDNVQKLVSMAYHSSGSMDPISFSVNICTDGTVVCDRHDCVVPDARLIDRVTPTQLAHLEAAFAAADFDHGPTAYQNAAASDPGSYEIYRFDGLRPRVMELYCSDPSTPRGVRELVRAFETEFEFARAQLDERTRGNRSATNRGASGRDDATPPTDSRPTTGPAPRSPR